MRFFGGKYKWLTLLILFLPLFFFLKDSKFKDSFRYNPSGKVFYEVKEQGELSYPDGKKLKLDNAYRLTGRVRKFGDNLEIRGKVTGKLDRKIEPLIPSKAFSLRMDLSSTRDFCPRTLSVIYPASMRRLFYFMPKGHLFEGKKWSGSFCGGNLSCRYRVERIENTTAVIDMNCDGRHLEQDIFMSGDLRLDIESSIFEELSAEIGVAAKTIHSNWKFHETRKKK